MDLSKHFWVRESEDSRDQASSESENGLADPETKRPQLLSSWQSRLRSTLQLQQTKDQPTWNSTWKRLGPLAGLFGLLIAILGVAASFVILYASNGAPTREWTIQPSTYLAIVTAIVNPVLGYAAFQGAVISWWMRAVDGSTIGALHQDWHSGTSFFGALSAGRSMNLLAVYYSCISLARTIALPWSLNSEIRHGFHNAQWTNFSPSKRVLCIASQHPKICRCDACILSSLVAVDGPLLQRATYAEDRDFNRPASIHVNIAPEIPHGLSGSYSRGAYNGSGTIMHGKSMHYTFGQTNIFTNTALEWASKSPIKASTKGCKGTCKARVEAPALAKTACTTSQFPFRPSKNSVKADALKTLDSITFYTDFEILPHVDQETINFTVAYRTASADKCDLGHVTYTNCQLRSAIGLYDIHIDEDQISIPSPGTAEILRLANNTAARPEDDMGSGSKISTLGGIAFQAFTVFNSLAHGYEDGSVFQNMGFTGFVQQFSLPLTDEEIQKLSAVNSPCTDFIRFTMLQYRFTDPSEHVLSGLNSLMFRFGLEAAEWKGSAFGLGPLFDKDTNSNQTLAGTQYGHETVFVTSYWWFGAGALANLVCILCILPTYWGWWRLGRSVSFSPLEMANAFEAPLLRDAKCPSNASGRHIATFMREKEVRYGATGNVSYSHEGYEAEKVAFAAPDIAYKLVDDCKFES